MTRSHADAFLEAILQNPDDDTPRLVYTDWLEEQGDADSVARAEFIRIQCALASGHFPPRRRTEMNRRQQQILHERGKEWAHPLRRLVKGWEFHRGFIDEVAIRGDTFFAHADRLFRRAPIQHLRFWPRLRPYSSGSVINIPFSEPINTAVLADNEHLRRLRSLDLSWHNLESRHLRALIVSTHLTGLTSLTLAYNRIGDSGIRALAEAPLLAQLRQLNLYRNDISTGGVRALAQSLERLARTSEGLRLRILDVRGNPISAAGRHLLGDSPLLQRVACW